MSGRVSVCMRRVERGIRSIRATIKTIFNSPFFKTNEKNRIKLSFI